jgi:hypothetical protein
MSVLRKITPEHRSAVPLRVDYLTDSQAAPTSIVYCTDIEGTRVRVAVRGRSAADPPWETGEWYRFDGVVRSRSCGADLLFPSGDGDAERIDTPERRTHPPLAELDAPWLVQLGASDEPIAVTVQPRPTDGVGNIRIEDPGTFEIGAVCFARCDGSGDTTVYHREEPDIQDEHLLLEHVVEDLSEAAGATLVTRGSDHRPLELLSQRLALASEGDIVETGAEQVLDECFHANTESVAVRAEADTLVAAARQQGIEHAPVVLSDYDIGISPVDWREDWELASTPLSDVSDPQMIDRDYATLVERYLATEDASIDPAQLARCLKAYASADLELLRELVRYGTMDQLGCPRLSGRLPGRDQSR